MTNQDTGRRKQRTLNLLLDRSPDRWKFSLKDGSDRNITLLYIQFCRLGRRTVECPRRLLTRGYRLVRLPRQLRLVSTLITSSYLLSSIESTQLVTANFTAGDVCLMSGIAFLTLWIRRAL